MYFALVFTNFDVYEGVFTIKKISIFEFLIGSLLIMSLILFVMNQHRQNKEFQRKEEVDMETTIQYQQIMKKLEQESQKGSPMNNMKGGKL